MGAYRLKHGGQASLLPLHTSRKHGPSGHEYRGHVDSGCRHQKARHVFVTVRNHYKRIKLVGQRHTFRGIRNQISCYQRIFHSHMAHGNSVEHHGNAARLGNAKLYRLHNLVKIHMSGNNLIVGADNAHHGLLHLLPGKSKGVEQASVRSLLYTCFYMITSHSSYSFRLSCLRIGNGSYLPLRLYNTKLSFS